MSETELKMIDNFEVCRKGLGSIKWPGITDVRGLQLDNIIHIGQGTVMVYPDEDSKPLRGLALNKAAVVSLKVKRHTHSPAEVRKLQERIQHLTEQAGHAFMSYDLSTWIFSVPNFDVKSC